MSGRVRWKPQRVRDPGAGGPLLDISKAVMSAEPRKAQGIETGPKQDRNSHLKLEGNGLHQQESAHKHLCTQYTAVKRKWKCNKFTIELLWKKSTTVEIEGICLSFTGQVTFIAKKPHGHLSVNMIDGAYYGSEMNIKHRPPEPGQTLSAR